MRPALVAGRCTCHASKRWYHGHLRMIAKITRATSSHSRTTCIICLSEGRRCTQPSTKVSFPFIWGVVILSHETKLIRPLKTPLIAAARREEAKSGLALILLRLRDGCSMAQSVVCTGNFFASICLLLHGRPTSIRSWLQHALRKRSKL